MSAPTEREIFEVENGINRGLADAAAEPRDPNPFVRQMQDDRDRLAYRGDFEAADALDLQVWERRTPELELEI